MEFRQLFEKSRSSKRDSGVALFMVIGAMTIMAMVVTEFTYVAQVNSRMSFDAVDQVKAHYLAKSGLKLSLVRIRAYQNLKALTSGNAGAGAGSMIPKGLLEKIWSFPFFYPIPTEIPGITPSEKDQISEFTKTTGIEGRFSTLIESESSKYNLNSLLAPFSAPAPTPTGTPTPAPGPQGPGPTPSPTPTFDPQQAQRSLSEYLTQILNQRIETDEDFATDYRDIRMDEFVDNLISWVDVQHQRSSAPSPNFRAKGGPFYSLSELRFIEPIDDRLYDMLAPNFTVSPVPGLNVNTVKDSTLNAVLNGRLTKEELEAFFKYRDDPTQDNTFKSEQEFFDYLARETGAFRDSNAIQTLRDDLSRRNIRMVTEENFFKVTVQAQVNQATRLIEAQVMIVPPRQPGSTQNQPPQTQIPQDGTNPQKDSGLRITSMRIL